jgi:hypothetical protein
MNREQLQAMSSCLEFKLHRLQFIELLKGGSDHQAAILAYARNLAPFASQHSKGTSFNKFYPLVTNLKLLLGVNINVHLNLVVCKFYFCAGVCRAAGTDGSSVVRPSGTRAVSLCVSVELGQLG